MKKIIVSAILIMAFSSISHAGLDNWTINGVPIKAFKSANTSDIIKLSAGILTSIAMHTVSHAIYLEATNTDWHFDGFGEVVDGDMSDSELTALGLSGFVGQLTVGSIIKLSGYENFFTTGYHMGSFLEVSTNPVIFGIGSNPNDPGDLNFKYSEYAYPALTLWSILNLNHKVK